ncbi:hypothetical protein P9D54_21935 [Bacillus haynesii]|uniref:hypothetical protein n=1 Tax=Bacillus haynesii TaxID=1925021 RepID=UPI002DBEA031|nr:hypothetical protein [Bacillus haynesii]MEC1348007.1 hypothetical protein [Bacillus haynesii]
MFLRGFTEKCDLTERQHIKTLRGLLKGEMEDFDIDDIKTIDQAWRKMQELLKDSRLSGPENYPARSDQGVVLLDQENELHKELK